MHIFKYSTVVLLATIAGTGIAIAQSIHAAVGQDPRASEGASLSTETSSTDDIATNMKNGAPVSTASHPLKTMRSYGPDVFGNIMAPLKYIIDPINDDVLVPTARVTVPISGALTPMIAAPQPLFFDRTKPIPVVLASSNNQIPLKPRKKVTKHYHRKNILAAEP